MGWSGGGVPGTPGRASSASTPSYCRDEWISLGQQLNTRETLSGIVWIVAAIALGWRASSRADEPQRCPTCGRVVSYGGDICGECGQSLCPTCGSVVSDDTAKCPACGTKFALSCPNCGAVVAARDAFCSQCGQAFA
jgi:RNA polymerase subunit RPABC4/transcription elongation factor Spt4